MKPLTQPEDISDQLSEALQLCLKRLQAIREEVDSCTGLVNLSLGCLAHVRPSAMREDLSELLDRQRAQIVEELVGALAPGKDRAPSEGPFRFSLIPQQRVAKVGRRKIPLTRSEFNLLEHLWKASPEPVSRKELLDHLYPDQKQPNEGVLDMFVFRIRQKLRNAGCKEVAIRVMRGTGWLLDVTEPEERLDQDELATADRQA